MRLVELTGVHGGTVWVNPNRLLFVSLAELGGGGSMYSKTDAPIMTKLTFEQGAAIEVKEVLADVLVRLEAA
jgi:hypothetical protein